MSDNPAQNTTSTPAQQTPTSAVTEGSPKREYTQAELDQMFNERATRASQTTSKKLLDQLGLTSEAEIESLKATIEKGRKAESDELTAAQRAEKLVNDEKKRSDDLAQKLEASETARRNAEIRHAVINAATKLASPDPDLVLLHVRSAHAAELKDLLTEDGVPDQKKLDALMETVKKEKALLFPVADANPGTQARGRTHQRAAGNPGSPSNSGGKPADAAAEALKRASRTNQRIIRGR